MNPMWTQVIHDTIERLTKKCPHCKRAATYPKKEVGRFYTCKHCKHRFREKGKLPTSSL
jgi:ribosomal protein L37AE/L43A